MWKAEGACLFNKWRREPFEEEKTTLIPGENLDGLKITAADTLSNQCERRTMSEPEPAASSESVTFL